MNIFWLHDDPEVCASYHCDKHIVKMCTEYAQILCTVLQNKYGRVYGLFKPTHSNHPCVKWAAERTSNFRALEALFYACCHEYTKRYGRVHKAQQVWYQSYQVRRIVFGRGPQTPVPLCMPDEYKRRSVIASYRALYNGPKARFAVWRHSPKPRWFKG